MRKELILTVLITFTCFQTVASDGNILRCLAEVGKTAKIALELALKIRAGNLDVITNIKDIIGKVNPLMTECTNPICLRDAQKRCEDSTGKQCEQWGAIMYPKCPEGTQPFGCCLCVPSCPEGFRNDGLFCAKPAPYGRGVGYPWKFGDGLNLDGAKNRCQAENPQLGCEQNGAIIYPKCQSSFHNVGCCVCSPDCPASMTDIGVSCAKKSVGRGLGYPMKYADCPNSKDNTTVSENTNSSLSIEQLTKTILDVVAELKSNESNAEKAVAIVSKLVGLLASLDQRINKK